MFARKPGKGITLEMYIRNTKVNKKKNKELKKKLKKKKKTTLCLQIKGRRSLEYTLETTRWQPSPPDPPGLALRRLTNVVVRGGGN